MKRDYLKKDTKQTKRMKKHSLLCCYNSGGEIYKLLSFEVLHNLVKGISQGIINLNSTLLYGRDKITYEENFISILDKYICYVKDTYRIMTNELLIVIEETLKNNYNRVLYIKSDFHSDPELFIRGFKKMFIANVVYNTRYYAKKDIDKKYTSLQQANMFFETKSFNDSKDLKAMEEFLINVVNTRRDNLYNLFIPHAEIDKKQLSFYLHQVDWIYEDYYKSKFTIFKN